MNGIPLTWQRDVIVEVKVEAEVAWLVAVYATSNITRY